MIPLPPIFEHPTVKRARAFLASLLPAERTQLLFLIGSVLIICVSPFAFSRTSPPFDILDVLKKGVPRRVVSDELWVVLRITVYVSFYIAGLAALALCFGGREQLCKRVSRFVLLPSIPGVAAMLVPVFLEQPRTQSVFATAVDRAQAFLSAMWKSIASPSVGMGMWLAAVALIGIGIWRVMNGRTTLPARFGINATGNPDLTSESANDARLLRYLLWVLPLSQIAHMVVQGVLFFLLSRIPPQSPWIKWGVVIDSIGALVPSVLPFLCAVWILDVRSDLVLPGALRRFGWLEGAAAVSIPAAAILLPASAKWGLLWIRWQINPALFDAPQWSTHQFSLVELSYLMLFFPAFAEELGWRGALQPVLIKRFGVRRGILLVGLIWGIWHLPLNVGPVSTLFLAPVIPFVRLLHSVLLGVCLGWLFLRTNSIWPVTLLHGAANIFTIGKSSVFPFELLTGWVGSMTFLIFALCGYLLFHFWPPAVARQPTAPSRWSRVQWPPRDDSPE